MSGHLNDKSVSAPYALCAGEARGTRASMTFDWRSDIIEPVRRAVIRLFRPDLRIVTGGIAFYALFSIFPLIYPALTLLTVFLPPELAVQLAAPIRNFSARMSRRCRWRTST